MSFARQRVPGGWTAGTTIQSAELDYWDESISNAIDGKAGGAYALEEDLVLGATVSAELHLEIVTTFHDNVTLANDTFITGPVYVYGQSGFYADTFFAAEVTASADVTLEASAELFVNGPTYHWGSVGFYENVYFESGSDPEFNAPAAFHQPVTFDAFVTVNANVDINGILTVDGPVLLGDAVSFTFIRGPSQINAPLKTAGTGCIVHRVEVGGPDDSIYSPLTVHEVVVDDATGTLDYKIDDSGCVDGNEIFFVNTDPSSALRIRRLADNVLIASLVQQGGKFVRVAGTWRCTARFDVPT